MATRRDFFKKGILAGAGLALLNNSWGSTTDPGVEPETEFTLPPLPYGYDALEPFIDKQTMEIHHTKHHQAYIDKLNKAVVDAKLSGIALDALCKNVSKYPVAVRNHGGGHYNHSMFWKAMKPASGSVLSPAPTNEPMGKLGDAIRSTFESFANLKTKFSEKAMGTFGSGWVWLIVDNKGKLAIGSTPNQDNPLMDVSELKGNPILGLDVWEHAYYLKYQNKRADYVNSWWNIVNWEEASARFEGK